MRKTLGLYIHVPFCVAKCLYCDFYSGAFPQKRQAAYTAALCKHLRTSAPRAAAYTVDTVYFGGGTPTLLPTESLLEILDTVKACFSLEAGAEITLECNPATISAQKARALYEGGFNRISIGAQSLCDEELRRLGRKHTAQQFLDTVHGVKAAGFQNISADLMFGIPGQTAASFQETLDRLIALELPHISAYGLRLEEGTPLFAMQQVLDLPDEDAQADLQLQAVEALTRAGYIHYEISNYAKAGFASRHNLRYWNRSPYLGFGPGAHSFFEEDRFSFQKDLAAYINAAERDAFCEIEEGRERIFGKDAQDEYVMLQMRLSAGVEEADFAYRFGTSVEKAYGDPAPLIAAGYLKRENGRVAFTERGMLVSNAILAQWLDFGKE